MTRLATAFYDKRGTLCATPPHMANPHNESRVLPCGFPALPDPTKFTHKVTMNPGYYHRFSDFYNTEQERANAARDLQQIFDAKNTSIFWANAFEYTPKMTDAQFDEMIAAGIPVDDIIDSMPKKRYVLDVIYVVEEPSRTPFHKMPNRMVHNASVSEYIDKDNIVLTDGEFTIPNPADAQPDLMLA